MSKVELRNVYMNYHSPKGETSALENINISIETGEFVSIVGPSGCGKSTLLNIISGLITPSKGEVLVDNEAIDKYSEKLGYMFQRDHLFEWLNVWDNVALGFIGGFTGDYLKTTLEKEGVKTDFIQVEGDTRINVKVKSARETEINGNGPEIHKNHMELLHEKLEKLTEDDYVVLSGNIQKSLPRDNLKGENIPYLARALTVVDSFDAMTSNRPYNIRKTYEEGVEELIRCSGTQFDPEIARAFIEVINSNKGQL